MNSFLRMKRLAEYISESILSSTRTGKTGIEDEMKRYDIDPAKATLNADGTIDYNGTVVLLRFGLTKLPFRFRKVKGDFDCSENYLTTLDGAPETVSGGFFCEYNNLTTLKGAPNTVGGVFNCSHNNLTSLVGLPKRLNWGLYCHDNSHDFTQEDVRALCNIKKSNIYI